MSETVVAGLTQRHVDPVSDLTRAWSEAVHEERRALGCRRGPAGVWLRAADARVAADEQETSYVDATGPRLGDLELVGWHGLQGDYS